MYSVIPDHLITRRKTVAVILDEHGYEHRVEASLSDALLWLFGNGQRTVPVIAMGKVHHVHLVRTTNLEETFPWPS
jgi:glutaredoxin